LEQILTIPEIVPTEIAVLAGMLVLGILLGWIFRGGRCAKEKIAVNAGWQEQLEAQRSEHERLVGQNQSLMEQISQYQASMKDSNLRAKELSDSLKETFERRDQLQVQLKEVRSDLDVAVARREKLKIQAQGRESRDETSLAAIRDRDRKISHLNLELADWQDRVPPLVERFRQRDKEAQEIETELAQARERIAALEATIGKDNTRIEPVDPNSLADGLNASNDPLDEATGEFESELVDQNTSYNESIADASDSPEMPDTDLGDDDETMEADALVSEGGPDDDETMEADGLASEGEPDDDETMEADALVSAGEPDDDTDDLKLIKGIGPAIEKTLNELGIYRFNQIAEMSEYDIDRVAQHMKGFRSRIYREDWVGQARGLQYQKNNEPA
jgi:NADH-quinone oxidoreductase subunit E